MKKTTLKSILVALIAITSFSACSNDDNSLNATMKTPESTVASKPPPPGLATFYYREAGTSAFTSVSNPHANATTKKIFGIDGSAYIVEMHLTSLAVGTYSIGALNKFYYIQPGSLNVWRALSGAVKITANASGTLSGTYFMKTGTGIPSVSGVNGYFEFVPVTP